MSRFQNLTFLEVEGSSNTKHLLSFPAARAMVHLKHLHIFECKGLEEVLVAEELGVEGRPNLFPRLECLLLKDLPILKRFCEGSNIEFPCLTKLILEHCPKLKTFITKPVSSRLTGSKEPNEMNAEEGSHAVMQPLFNEKIGFPSLEILIIFHMDDLKIIWQNQFAADSFCNLKFLFVKSCENLKNVFSASVARCLLHLEKMQIVDCGVEEIVAGEGVEGIARFVFPQVTHLDLISLPRLKWFYPGAHTSEWPMLELICVHGCQKIEIFASKLMSFQGALQESQLDISSKQRFFFSDEVVFPHLGMLELSSQALAEPQHSQHRATSSRTLTNMPSTSGFQNLLSLEVQGSENVRYLLSFSTARLLVHLKHLHIFKWKFMEEVLVGEELLVEERSTLFPRLECLFLDDLPILKRFCFGTNIEFPSLDNLRIENCPELNTFISKSGSSSMIVTVSHELGKINAAESSHSIMQPLFNEEVAFPSLENLKIVGINNLQILWPNQFAVDYLLQLKSMVAECCENLVNIFPPSVARCLQQLEKLRIVNCGVEELVAEQGGAEAIGSFVFPEVTMLHLISLPRLKWFYPGVHSSKWPKLKEIWMSGCEKVEIFASELLSFQETLQESQLDISNKQPLFLVDEATFPNLEVLRLEDYHNIWLGHVLEERFCKLKILKLTCTHNQSAVFPWNFLIRLHNLENLVLIGSCWEEIFLNEELARGSVKHAQILPRLRELKLSKQSILTQIWKEDTQLPRPAFHILETLEVSECEELKKFVPSSVSFKNLKILEILKCPQLINLFASSTAKSLVQLKKMRVCECETIIEIVAEEVSEANEVITFHKLTCLELYCLENLTKFCLGSSAFKFPSLKEVIVRQCPKLKVFCDGVLSTPKLQRVKVTKEDEWHWKDDLNSTLHLLWQEKQ